MRASVTSLSKKFISTFFAATLALGLVPAAAFAVEGEPTEETPVENIVDESGISDVDEIEADSVIIPAGQIINQEMPLEVVAQQESTRSYFLAQTLESTRTVPIVSANLPLDTSSVDVVEPEVEAEGSASQEEESDDGEDDPDADDPSRAISTEAGDSERSGEISAASTVIGSFTYRGITYAVEPGGESVAVVAADYAKLPEEFIEAQAIVIPSVVTFDGLNYYSVTRVADYSFANIKTEDDDITVVGIPASVTNIEPDAFTDFAALQYIVVDEDNPNYSSYDGVLYDADQTSLLLIPEGRLGAVRIAPSVTEIDPEVFSHCPSVDTLVADADSAAYQLLSEDAEIYTSMNKTALRIVSSEEAAYLSVPEIEYAKYEEMAQSDELGLLAVPDSDMEMRSIQGVSDTGDGVKYLQKYGFTIYDYDTYYDSNRNWSEPVLVQTVVSARNDRAGFGYVGIGDFRCTQTSGTPHGLGALPQSHFQVGLVDDVGDRYVRLNTNSTGAYYFQLWFRNDIGFYTTYASSRLNESTANNADRVWQVCDSAGYVLQCRNGALRSTGDWTFGSISNLQRRLVMSVEPNFIRVSYRLQGGTSSNPLFYDLSPYYQNDGVPATFTVREGSTPPSALSQVFKEWNTLPDGTGTAYRPGDTIESLTNVTLYAIYTQGYEITLDPANGSGGTKSFIALNADKPAPPASEIIPPTREHYTFEGFYLPTENGREFWYSVDGSGNLVRNSANIESHYPLTGPLTLYAQWSRNDVRLDANNGSSDPTMHTIGRVVWDEEVPSLDGLEIKTVNSYKPQPEADYEFDGFYTAANGGVRYYDEKLNPIASFSEDTDVLYAHWRNKNDVHDHIYCSSASDPEKNKIADDGYAYGWTCPSYDTYVAKVYVSGTPQQSHEQYVAGVPAYVPGGEGEPDYAPSGVMSVDAVKAGEYYLIAGGRNADGVLPTKDTNPSADPNKIDAWWEITSKTADGPGTLRIHSDRGAVITLKLIEDDFDTCATPSPDRNSTNAWANNALMPHIKHAVFDHVDANNCNGWFATSPQPYHPDYSVLESIAFIGNTFPPHAAAAASFANGAGRLYEFSDNFTLLNSDLVSAVCMFDHDGAINGFPKGFTLAGSSIQAAYAFMHTNMNVLALPDGFEGSGKIGSGYFERVLFFTVYQNNPFNFTEELIPTDIMKNTGKMIGNNPTLFYAGSDSEVIQLIGNAASPYLDRARVQKTSVTWNGRGGTFSPSYSRLDSSRAYELTSPVTLPTGVGSATGLTNTTQIVRPERNNDPFLGWYKKVPMTGTALNGTVDMSTPEKNGITWAEHRYLFDYGFVWDGKDVSKAPVVDNTNESIVYYAMYESDRDKIKANIELKTNDGTGTDGLGTTFATVTDQVNGQAMKAIPRSLSELSFGNYEFDGFWTAPIGGKQYYKADGTSANPWIELETSATLYAHWKYKVVFNGNVNNFKDTNGVDKTASVDWDNMPAGSAAEGFTKVTSGEGAPYIEALYGAAVPLPKAFREGYKDTRAWGLTAGSDGQSGWVMKATSDFYSADIAGQKATPAKASYTRNGAATDTYTVALNKDHELHLFANWLWDENTPSGDKVEPGGGKEKYTVRLKAAYTEDNVTYAATWPAGTALNGGDVVLSDVEYDSVISEKHLTMGAPSFVSATGYGPLVFRGFYTAPNVPTPAEGESYKGARLIKTDEDDETKLVGEGAMRLLPVAQPNGQKEIVLYALWALPNTGVVFHLNTAGLEDVVGYDAVKDGADVLAPAAEGGIYTVTIKTNETIPEIVGDNIENAIDTEAIGNGSYVFNGWWTHPWKEGAGSVQYYGADNERMTDENDEVLTWKPYADTVLYAHWTYKVKLDANVPADAAGADDVKLQHLAKVGDHTGSAVTGTPDGDALIDSTSGNVYRYEAAAEGETARKHLLQADEIAIDAVLGAPVKLPFARFRVGYDDTVIWNDAAGNTVAVTKDGWTSDELGGTKLSKMSFAGTPDATHAITLTADWSGSHEEEGFGGGALKYTVNLIAAYDGITLTGADETAGTSRIENVEYDAAFSASTETHTVTAPWRNGYTFLGYYAAKPTNENPQGTPWVAAPTDALAQTAALSKQKWDLVPEQGKTEIDLYAAWKKDAYNVTFAPTALKGAGALEALTPGTEPVTASTIANRTWSYGEKMNASQFPVASKLQESPSPFFRNGYDFRGWYYVAEDGKSVKVSEGAGTPGGDEYGRDVTWTPSKAWQVEHRKDTEASVTLYAAWAPKVYEIAFDLARPGETDAPVPSATYPAAENRDNVKKAADGTWYYEVEYGSEFAPWFGSDGTTAAVPEFEPYAFTGWTYQGERLFENDDKQASGTFAPPYDIARWSEGVNVITYTGTWKAPGAKTVTFHADEHGTYEEGTDHYVNASTLRVEGFEYSPTPVEIGSDMDPQAHAGYSFWGYVAGPASGERPTDLYADGKPNTAYSRVLALTKVAEDAHLWAVYSKSPMSATLKVPSGASVYESEATDAKLAPLTYPFDVEDDPFTLPTDVRQAGKRFTGWKLEETSDKPSKSITVTPSTIAGSTNTSLVYVPVMEDRIYRVTFDPNYRTAASTSAGETKYVYLTYDGLVADAGTLAGAAKGQSLSKMPGVPEPKAQTIDGKTWRSLAFTSWWVGASSSVGNPTKKSANDEVTVNEWHAFFDKESFTKPLESDAMTDADKAAKATDALNVYAAWEANVSAVCPLYVPLALDTQTGDVAITTEDYGIESASGASLRIAALRYDRIDSVDSNGTKVSPFARANDSEVPVYLNVFAGDAAADLDMGRAKIENGVVAGEYGTGGDRGSVLRIDLSAPSAVYTAGPDALFAAFGKGSATESTPGALRIRYGLDLDGVSTATLARIRTLMPSQNGTLQANGWTAEKVPVALLLYTVQLAK